MRAALIIDHVEMMSRMMEEGYEFGDRDGEMEEDDGEDGAGDSGDVTKEVAYGDVDTPFGEDSSGSLEEKDEHEESGREEGGDEDGDGDSDGEKEDEDSYSSWIRRGVSFSAGVTCTACTENGGN